MKKLSELEKRHLIAVEFYNTLWERLKELKPKWVAKLLWIDEARISRIVNKDDYWLTHKSMVNYLKILKQ